jgi:AcrR family transcriptional regulator
VGLDAAAGLRERKKERTHQDLVEAGLRMFAERGFDAVTVEDIAAEVDVSPRTFYRYFATKEDLLLDDLSTALDVLRRSFLAQPADLPVMAAVRAVLMEVTQTYEGLARQKLQRARIVEATPSLKFRHAERQTAWEQVLAPLVSERIGDPPGDPSLKAQLIASCAMAALRVAFSAWRVDEGKVRLTDLVAEALDLLSGSFGE